MAKAIMVQGTMSNVGKSLLCAGLCRIFRQDGYRTAPFKSQNMALNSYITGEGLEMGRAQVMQAQAAGILPSVDMNPILLKPVNDTGSQVIVGGEVLGNYSAREYFAFKRSLVPRIMESYRRLDEAFDIIVIEGAGSPAEINLKKDDIVNMGMARLAQAPVLLVGDIDRGGVFAQLIGTVDLLEEDERSMVRGLVINKFRGDKTILDPGIAMLEQRAGIPVVGVTPYLNICVDDEDSLTERFEGNTGTLYGQVKGEGFIKEETGIKGSGMIDIAVIRLPRISNFTDFTPLEIIEGVTLRYVTTPRQLGHPDLIILPGTKNTMGDLAWLRQSGLETLILKEAEAGTAVLGICGGYQMLGEMIHDPHGTEEGGSMRGMGLLPLNTVFADQKTRTQVKGTFDRTGGWLSPLQGVPVEGYEIHMGITSRCVTPSGMPDEEQSCSFAGKDMPVSLTRIKACSGSRSEEKADGTLSGNVMGTYIHGIFDRPETAEGFVRCLAQKKGADPDRITSPDPAAFRESQYDMLADAMREHMDMEKIYEILMAGL